MKGLYMILLGAVSFTFTAMGQTTNTFPLDGNVGIGTIAPENAESWQRVLEVKGFYDSKMLVSTDQINSGIWSHSFGFYGAPLGGMTGTATNHHYSIITNKIARMIVTSGGDVGIGTMDPRGYKLAVAGNMIAESVKVSLQGMWPDYVFAKDYQLPTLQETEKHIKDKGHLPGIPSAAEVKNNGIDLGEMNAKLLQKIEELTLHLIEMEKKCNIQQKLNEKQNKEFSAAITELKSKIKYQK